ncbi:DUF2059 domain-containing protein [Alcanivorax sp. S6407]|uniref:DUF2059 domain-containing protein n=1 Tax=Alcanivorax sp. S6407 TaxID=2926424 RepID=UPI001FF6682E|nr:DUF2059 domain-containing protein [Alcanivorax sp. S6407]MCK0154361.1 DUF2059 domain-containing protein [Alcanivorax sp. S6407]
MPYSLSARLSLTVRTFLILLLTPSLLLADTGSETAALLDQSGFNEQITHWPDMIRAEIRQHGEITDDNLDLILTRADSDSLVKRLQASVQQHTAETLSAADLSAISQWYQSALGKRITAEEVQAASEEGLLQMQQQASNLLADSDRVATIRQLDALSGTTDTALALHSYSAQAVAKAIPGNDAEAHSPASDPSALREQIEQRVELAFLYAYRNLDNDSLQRYQQFLASEPAQRFYHAIHEGMTRTLSAEIDAWATELHNAMSVPELAPAQ